MEFDNNIPIYVQVINDIKKDIVNGVLALGEKLPSGRDLALKYQINPNTSNRIYREMEAEGLCYTRRGLGTYVTEDGDKIEEIRKEMANDLLTRFIEGMKCFGYSKDDILTMVTDKFQETEE